MDVFELFIGVLVNLSKFLTLYQLIFDTKTNR